MIPTNHLLLKYLKRNTQYTIVRCIRGGMTIPLKEPRRTPKPRKPFENNDALFWKNEGIGRRLKMFMEDGELEKKDLTEIDIDDLEPQLMNYGQAYKKHFQEMAIKDLKKHRYGVARRHFKDEKLPNMLTYGEKQQIKRLHADDPDMWTEQKLASSFPATPAIIRQILKADWKPRNEKQLLSHDKTVEKNWKLFREDKLKFKDVDLQSHFAKFTNRHSTVYTQSEMKHLLQRPTAKPKAGEFGGIILKYKKLIGAPDGNNLLIEGETSRINVTADARTIDEGESTFGKFNRINKSHITLEEYRQRIQAHKNLSTVDKLILEGSKNNNNNNNSSAKTQDFSNDYNGTDDNDRDNYVETLGSNTKVISKQTSKVEDFLTDNIKLRINIPTELWERGMTYKIRDCFYDDDGLFLYRVPGFVS